MYGARDVPLAHRVREKDDEAWRFIWDVDDEAGLAGIVLLASVQELIRRKWHSVDFAVSLVGPPDA